MIKIISYRLNLFSLLPFNSNSFNQINENKVSVYNKDLLIFKALLFSILKTNLSDLDIKKNLNSNIIIKVDYNYNKIKKKIFTENILRSSYKDKVAQLSYEKKIFKMSLKINIYSSLNIFWDYYLFFRIIKIFKFFETKLLIQFSKEMKFISLYRFL